jgi:hypothetical protein
MRLSLAVLAIAVPANSLSAEEIAIRCDHIGSPGAVLLFIDTISKTVQWGKGPNSERFADHREYQTRDKDTPKDQWGPGSVGCVFNWSDFVHITDDKIEFGKSSVNTNWCGRADRPTEPRAEKKSYVYSINRNTAFANLSNDTDSPPDYRCQKFTGSLF